MMMLMKIIIKDFLFHESAVVHEATSRRNENDGTYIEVQFYTESNYKRKAINWECQRQTKTKSLKSIILIMKY